MCSEQITNFLGSSFRNGVRCFTTQLSTSPMVQHRTSDLFMASGIYWLNFNLGWSPQDALSSCGSAFPQAGWKSCSNKNCSLIMSWDHPTWTPTFKNRNQVPYKTNASLMLSQLIHQCINLVTQLPHRLSKTKRSWGYCNFAKKKSGVLPYLLQPKFDYTICHAFLFSVPFFGWCVFIQEGTWIRNQVFPVDKIRWGIVVEVFNGWNGKKKPTLPTLLKFKIETPK